PERAPVAHQPQRDERPDPLPELVRVEAAERDCRSLAAELVPAAQVSLGRVGEHLSGAGQEADDLRDAAQALARVSGKAPQLDAVQGGTGEIAERHPAGAILEPLRALRPGMRSEAEAAAVAHRLADRGRREAAVAHVPVE